VGALGVLFKKNRAQTASIKPTHAGNNGERGWNGQ
jgi:hypothetical protein